MPDCQICGKTQHSARKFSYRGSYVTKRALRTQKPNVRRVKVIEENGTVKHLYVCSKCMRAGKVKRVAG